jgi:hypothetical protein
MTSLKVIIQHPAVSVSVATCNGCKKLRIMNPGLLFWPHYLLVGGGVGRQACKRGNTAFSVCLRNVYIGELNSSLPTKHFFFLRSNAIRPFRGEPSSGHAVPSASLHSVRDPS